MLIAHHQVGPQGHPQLAALPPNTGDFLIIPMYAMVNEEKVVIENDWVHPDAALVNVPYVVPVRGPRRFANERKLTIDEQRHRSNPAQPTIYLTIGNAVGPRFHYNAPDVAVPNAANRRSRHRTGDWARFYRVELPVAQNLGQQAQAIAAFHAAMRQHRSDIEFP
jgi:hypothetical protein